MLLRMSERPTAQKVKEMRKAVVGCEAEGVVVEGIFPLLDLRRLRYWHLKMRGFLPPFSLVIRSQFREFMTCIFDHVSATTLAADSPVHFAAYERAMVVFDSPYNDRSVQFRGYLWMRTPMFPSASPFRRFGIRCSCAMQMSNVFLFVCVQFCCFAVFCDVPALVDEVSDC